MRTDTSNAMDTVMNDTKIVLGVVREEIYKTLDINENVGLGTLADKIAYDLTTNGGFIGIDSAFVKDVIGFYLNRNPELVCIKGKLGIMFADVYAKKKSKAEAANDLKTLSKYAKTAKELGFTDKAMFERAKRTLGEKPTIAALKEWITNNGKEAAA